MLQQAPGSASAHDEGSLPGYAMFDYLGIVQPLALHVPWKPGLTYFACTATLRQPVPATACAQCSLGQQPTRSNAATMKNYILGYHARLGVLPRDVQDTKKAEYIDLDVPGGLEAVRIRARGRACFLSPASFAGGAGSFDRAST